MAKFKKASDIRVGVVGYGGAFNMGKAHLDQMKKAGMTPVAVCEIDRDRLKVAEEDFPGIQTFTSLGQMLKKADVNFITIITPHNTHAKLAIQALKSGCSVCCEKPLAITTAEVDRMIQAAKQNRAVLTTYHNRHWDGCILKAKQVIERGTIGDITRIECHMGGYGKPGDWWRTSKTISGGILYDWGVHLLEYSLQLIQGNITEVSGFARTGYWADQTAWKADTNEDEGFAVVRFDTGQWLTLTITHLDVNEKSKDRGQLEITGAKGTYIFNGGSYKIIKPARKKGDPPKITEGKNPPSKGHLYYQNVADHMVTGEKLIIDGVWSRRPIHILDLANQSAKTGKAMKAKYK